MKTINKNRKIVSLVSTLALGLALTGCGTADRLANIGKAPGMSPIENPTMMAGYQPISMPMPAPVMAVRQPNSLWDSNRQTFFKDQRAANIGDILTVLIEIDDQAKVDNESTRERANDESASLGSLLGYEQALNKVFPEAIDNTNLANLESASNHEGKGTIDRKEQIEVKLAATITQMLPNGNFVLRGSQEVRVNFEKRILTVEGVIRPQDISINNTVDYEQIAEARIAYGGKGQITDVQQPRYGQQLYDVVFPF